MNESQFADELVAKLRPLPECEIKTKRSVFYALSFDERGRLHPEVARLHEPSRGGGTGFEQDILVFERNEAGDTEIIPRVIAEVKFEGVTTHDTIVYSEKACRIRTIYPYVRYGLLLGKMDRIPARVLRLGQEFDFITVVSDLASDEEIGALRELIEEEVKASRDLGPLLTGGKRITSLHRRLILGSPTDWAS